MQPLPAGWSPRGCLWLGHLMKELSSAGGEDLPWADRAPYHRASQTGSKHAQLPHADMPRPPAEVVLATQPGTKAEDPRIAGDTSTVTSSESSSALHFSNSTVVGKHPVAS